MRKGDIIQNLPCKILDGRDHYEHLDHIKIRSLNDIPGINRSVPVVEVICLKARARVCVCMSTFVKGMWTTKC
jgi:hypothetical protein